MKERRAAMRQDPNYKKPADMIQWIIDNSDAKNGKSAKYVTQNQMLISVVATHTTATTVSYDPDTFYVLQNNDHPADGTSGV